MHCFFLIPSMIPPSPPPRPAMSVIFNEMIKKYSSYYSSTFIQFTLGFDSIHTKVEFGLQ